jgi:hypothetical protein
MSSLLEWLTKERCLWHAEPIFDRDLAGQSVFRCPRCMDTWPILPAQRPHHPPAAPLPFEAAAARARRRVVRLPEARVLAPGR